jgi:hypothetical protein
VRRQDARDRHHRTDTAAVRGRRYPYAPREQIAEAAQAGEADFHAHVGHRVLAHRKQFLRAVESCLHSILVRRPAEEGVKLPDEVKRRYPRLARDRLN